MPILLAALLALHGGACSQPAEGAVHEGDIVFHTSLSNQSRAIQLATKSPYSHMGIILFRDGKPYVLEAVAQVRLTPFGEWVERGEGGRFVIKRLRDDAVLGKPANMAKLREAASSLAGRSYDPYFEWSDDRIYCSELVWKAYERALGIHLGSLAPLKSFDLSHQLVKEKLAERYGVRVPLDEQVISPGAIFASPLLRETR